MRPISLLSDQNTFSDFYVSKQRSGPFRVGLYAIDSVQEGGAFYCTGPERARFKKEGYQIGARVGFAAKHPGASRYPIFRAHNPVAKNYLCTTSVDVIDEKGPSLEKDELEKKLIAWLEAYVHPDLKKIWSADIPGLKKIWLADNKYFCTTRKVAEKIIQISVSERRRYKDESFDCDDYAHLMKTGFINDLYYNRKRSCAYAFGILWGVGREKPLSMLGPEDKDTRFPHALNFVIVSEGNDDDFALWIVEPKDGKWYELKDGMITDIELAVC